MFSKYLILIFASYLALTIAAVKFTNIKCEELQPIFAKILKCKLKMVQRGIAALDIHVKLLKLPVHNISVTSALYKKANGFRPFLYNTTLDFCDYMKHKKKYPFFNIVMNMFGKDSNINHTCPYNHDIIVHNVILKESMFQHLPLPSGEYMCHLTVYAYNDPKAIVKAYLQQIE